MTTITTNDCPPAILLMVMTAAKSTCDALGRPKMCDRLPFGIDDVESNSWSSRPLSSLPKLTTYAEFLATNNKSFSLSTILEFARVPSSSLGSVASYDSIVVLGCLVLLMRYLKAFTIPRFCKIGETMARRTHGDEWVRKNEEKIIKFGEYVFRLLYHSSVSIFGLWYFFDKPWWDEAKGGTSLLFEGYPNHTIDPGMALYYLLQCAYNVEALISLLELSVTVTFQNPFASKKFLSQSPLKIGWSPTLRGDFTEMFIHHVITNLLVVGSSVYRFTRIGSMVFLIHDVSDVPVDLSKLANFMKWKIATVTCFVLLMAVWAVTRLWILPFVIIKATFDHSPIMCETGALDLWSYQLQGTIFQALLLGITCLHAFWYVILIRIGYRLVAKGQVHDLTEHKQGEEQHLAQKKLR